MSDIERDFEEPDFKIAPQTPEIVVEATLPQSAPRDQVVDDPLGREMVDVGRQIVGLLGEVRDAIRGYTPTRRSRGRTPVEIAGPSGVV
jgi:hypothetical protein